MVCRDDFSWCASMILWCAGMIKGETEGSEATRAVVEAAKAVAGGNLLCSRSEKLFILLENEADQLVPALAAAAEENIEVTTVVKEVQARLQV